MIKRLAVIIAGEYRTWAVCHKYLFKFFENRAEQVDYYFVTWDRTSFAKRREAEYKPVTDEDVTKYFDDKNRLVRYKIVDTEDCANTHSYVLKAYLSKIGNILKREVETSEEFVYDQVIDTRPDIYFRDTDSRHPFTQLADFQLVLGDETVRDFIITVTRQGYLNIADIYQRTTSLTHDVLSARILDSRSELSLDFCNKVLDRHTHHHIFSNYILNKGIIPYFVPDYAFYVPVRYNISPDVDLDKLPYEHLHELFKSADTE